MPTPFLLVYLLSAGFLLHCATLGFALLKLVGGSPAMRSPEANEYLQWFFALALGFLINILGLFSLGMLGWLNLWAWMLMAIAMLLMALWLLVPNRQSLPEFNWSVFFLVNVLLAMCIAFAWHPPLGSDDTAFHLPLARFYVEQQGIVLQEYLRFPLFPQHINMLMVLGLLLGDSLLAQVFATLPWFVIALGLMGVSRWLMESIWPGLFGALVMTKWVGVFSHGFGYAFVDAGLAMFCWAAILGGILWLQTLDKKSSSAPLFLGANGWILIAGLCAGGAVGSKLHGAVLATILALMLIAFSRQFKAVILFGMATLAAGLCWYIRSFVISGDPVHPLGGPLFGYFLWNESDLQNQIKEQATHGVAANLLNLWPALLKARVELWVLAFAGLFWKGLPKTLRYLQLVFISYFLFWFFVSQVDRYLAPIAVLGSFLSIYTLYVWLRALWFRLNLGRFMNETVKQCAQALCAVSLLIICVILGQKSVQTSSGWQTRLHQIHGYALVEQANQMQTEYGNRLMALGLGTANYFFAGTYIGDWFGPARYWQMMECRAHCLPVDAESMAEVMRRFDAKILLISAHLVPTFDPTSYSEKFQLVKQNADGFLFVLRSDANASP